MSWIDDHQSEINEAEAEYDDELQKLKRKLDIAKHAMNNVKNYLNQSYETQATTAAYYTPAQAMRMAADEIEKRDHAIELFRDALEEIEK